MAEFTLRQAQQITGWSDEFFRNRIRSGQIKARLVGNKYMLREEDVLALVKRGHTKENTEEAATKPVQSLSLFPSETLPELFKQGKSLKATPGEDGSMLFQYAPQDESETMQALLRGGSLILVVLIVALLLWLAYTHREEIKETWNKLTFKVPSLPKADNMEDIKRTVESLPSKDLAKLQQVLSEPDVLQSLLDVA